MGIADVDAFVAKGSPLDVHALNNTTSVYTGVVTSPMFPEKLSNDISSLLPGDDKLSVVVDMVLNSEGQVVEVDVYRALVRNYAKLAYSSIGKWLVAANSAVAGLLDKKGTYSLRRIVRKPKRWPRIVELAKELGETLPDEPDSRALSDFLKKR